MQSGDKVFNMIEKVFILHHTHVDFGYCGHVNTKDRECDNLVAMVDEAIELIDRSADRPEPQRFRWIHEVSWPVIEYLRRGGKNKDKLFAQIRKGYAELAALYVNPTDLFDRDTYEYSIDYACELARTNNFDLTTAMFVDVPGIAWSIPDILAARNIKYLSTGANFIMSNPLEVERPFYWEGPDGGRVLTWLADWRNNGYVEGIQYLKLHEDPADATARLLDYIKQIEQEGYRWKGLAIHLSVDNHPPIPKIMDFVAHFNAAQSKIETTLATNRDFFTFMENNHHEQFQVHRGAWPDWWACGNASAAFETACSRRSKVLLRRSKALARMLDQKIDAEQLDSVMQDLLLYDEHTYGWS